jgi:single-strand selective monofunctional uracil DNA glycosylase
VIGIGRFAEERASHALLGLELPIAAVPHPSPANPAANRGWTEALERRLTELGVRVEGARAES